MFLGKIKSFISNALSSIESYKPTAPFDSNLDMKVKHLVDYIIKGIDGNQFKAYQHLQTPEFDLNTNLRLIYHRKAVSTEEVVSIVNFYVFLLTNCTNELILCKLVSEPFVIELTEVYLHQLFQVHNKPKSLKLQPNPNDDQKHTQEDMSIKESASEVKESQGCEMKVEESEGSGRMVETVENNENLDIEEINAYKIALIKAYISTINEETIKYMILEDQIPIFHNCISIYWQYLEVEEKMFFGVETTCIANSLLILMHHLNANQELTNIAYLPSSHSHKQPNQLIKFIVQRLHASILQITKSDLIEMNKLQMLESNILFLVDLLQSINSIFYRDSIISEVSPELAEIVEILDLVIRLHIVPEQTQILIEPNCEHALHNNYHNGIELLKCLFKLLTVYGHELIVVALIEKYLISILNKFIAIAQQILPLILQELNEPLNQETQQSKTGQRAKISFMNVFCNHMEIMGRLLKSPLCKLSIRKNIEKETQQNKFLLVAKINTIIELILNHDYRLVFESICLKSIKCLLISLLQATLSNSKGTSIHEYSVLALYKFCIENVKKVARANENWDYMVMHYESLMKSVTYCLLEIDSADNLEYSYCLFHDCNKCSVEHSTQYVRNAILINECMRNFRFMMVESTTVSIKLMKLEKIYHNHFITSGWSYEPGLTISANAAVICDLFHLSNSNRLPIVVLEDEESLILAIRIISKQTKQITDQQSYKIMANIRYKNIHGFTCQKQIIHIKLKGIQEILVEPNDSKASANNTKKFKEYLIARRDKSRQKELTFIHFYLNLYQQDIDKVIEQMGEQDIIEANQIQPQASIQQKQEDEQKQNASEEKRLNLLSLQKIQESHEENLKERPEEMFKEFQSKEDFQDTQERVLQNQGTKESSFEENLEINKEDKSVNIIKKQQIQTIQQTLIQRDEIYKQSNESKMEKDERKSLTQNEEDKKGQEKTKQEPGQNTEEVLSIQQLI